MTKKSCFFSREPHWIESRTGIKGSIPPAARSWIYEPGSLTRRLRRSCGNAFGVRVLNQGWGRPFSGEERVLRLRHGRHALIREVKLERGGEPLILARTIIPKSTLRGAQRGLSHLGSRPLGEVIFSYPKLRRLSLQLACLEESDWLANMTSECVFLSDVWGRRTVYSIEGRNLLVCEFFLPEVLSLR
ncbi:MAG: chorismate lyase [Pseudomonadota bacterium]